MKNRVWRRSCRFWSCPHRSWSARSGRSPRRRGRAASWNRPRKRTVFSPYCVPVLTLSPRCVMLRRTAESNRRGQRGSSMRQSRDRILTSHVGSLPRPDALIAANRAREAGRVTTSRDSGTLGSAVGGRRAPAAGGRHRRSRRRRVRQVDGAARQLRLVVALFLPAPRRPRTGTRGCTTCPPRRSQPGRDRADELRRPPRSPRFAAAYADPGIRHHHRTPPAALARSASAVTYTGHDAIRADIASTSRRRSPPPASRRAS